MLRAATPARLDSGQELRPSRCPDARVRYAARHQARGTRGGARFRVQSWRPLPVQPSDIVLFSAQTHVLEGLDAAKLVITPRPDRLPRKPGVARLRNGHDRVARFAKH